MSKEEIAAKKSAVAKARLERIKSDPMLLAKHKEKERLKYIKKKEKGQRKLVKDMTLRYCARRRKKPLTAAEKQRRYRERLKNNPEKEAEIKRKHRERYHMTKRLVRDLTRREHRAMKEKWRSADGSYKMFHTGKGISVLFDNYSYSFKEKGKSLLVCSRKRSCGCEAKYGSYRVINGGKGISVLFDNYSYSFKEKGKSILVCSKKRSCGCEAKCADFAEIIKLSAKIVVLHKGYTYSRQGRNQNLYYCSKKYVKCSAKLKLYEKNTVVEGPGDHDHYPPKIIKAPDVTSNKLAIVIIGEPGRRLLLKEQNLFHKQRPDIAEIIKVGGKTVVLYKGYTYSRQGQSQNLVYCSKKNSMQCPAKLKLDPNDFELAVVNNKQLMLYQQYTYSKRGPSLKYWYCSKKQRQHCGAKVKLDDAKRIVSVDSNHNHPPPKFYKRCDEHYEMVLVNGRNLMMYKDYTYSNHGPSFRYWYCSKKKAPLYCGAKLKLDNDRRIESAITTHNHPPPKFYKTNNGQLFKLD
ncbi:unnamed protein product [Diatraea saccharalis]|uniref:FLYWCH-type domain-containing protein n=1 Tax=Diatraea saccharalis TaxID=40085 RepID=A0A9N9R1C4_9NEOP|nr:unnamed protein product [Diatraea saccharalis]